MRGLSVGHLCLCGLAALASGCTAQGYPESGYGPIAIRNQYPLTLLHSAFKPQAASVQQRGETSVGAVMTLSNTFDPKEETFQIDTETRVADQRVLHGLGAGFETQIGQQIISRGGGHTDQLIDEFHRAFGLSEGDRDGVVRDEFEISGVNSDGSAFGISRDGIGLGGLEIGLKYTPSSPEDAARFAVLSEIGLPTGTEEFGHDGVDVQLAFYTESDILSWRIFLGGGGMYIDDTEVNNLKMRSTHFAGFLGAQRALTDWAALYLGLNTGSRLLDNVEGLRTDQSYIDVGFRFLPSPAWILDFSIRENILHTRGTTDFTSVLGITFKP